MVADGLRLFVVVVALLLIGAVAVVETQGLTGGVGGAGFCRVEECAEWFQRTKEYESLQAASSERYCQVLQSYLQCMNDTLRFCHGNLRFHSSALVMQHHWNDYNCHRFQNLENKANRCHMPAQNMSGRSMKLCALFGDPHLLRFDRKFETCTEEGARPLVDNRYFLLQVTNSNVRGEALTTAVSKVTVLIRSHNCTASLRYEAASDEASLPIAFTDGTTSQRADQHRNSVEVLWQGPHHVEIALHHVHASIHVRRQGPYLAVAVRAPKHVLETGTTESNELCWSGCRKTARVAVHDALAAPDEFAACYARKILVPRKIAIDRCNDVGVTDEFFDACVFDLMLTGDDYLVSLAAAAQSDVRRLSHHHFSGRISLPPAAETEPIFDRCLADSASKPVFWALMFCVFWQFLIFFFLRLNENFC